MSITPPAPSASPPIGGSFEQVHLGVTLMNQNKFHECTAMFSQLAPRDLKMGLLHAYLSFVRAMSSHAESDLKDALALVWSLDKRADAQKTAPLEGKLIQADTHFLGAIVQLTSQKYIKAAWNLRKVSKRATTRDIRESTHITVLTHHRRFHFAFSPLPSLQSFNFYQSASKDLASYTGADRDQLAGWCDYGNGFFQLVLSFLPPSVMKVASWTGYGGDRDLGLSLLHRSQQSTSFMAPFSCLLLLTYYSSIASFTGEPEETYLALSEPLFDWAHERFPDGVMFLLMRSRAWRCRRDLLQAIDVAKQAIHNCSELPSVAVLFHFNTGFCSLFLLDWQQSAFYFDQLLHVTPSGEYEPPSDSQHVKHTAGELDLIASEGRATRMPPAKASALTFYACLCGINYMLLEMPHKARWYLGLVDKLADSSSKKPIDLFARRRSAEMLARKHGDLPEDALLDVCEVIFTWNGSSQMPESSCRRMLELLDAAEAKRLPHWKADQKAQLCLYRADMLKGLNDIAGARAQMAVFMTFVPALQSSSQAKLDGTLAFGYYLSAFLLVLDSQVAPAAEHLKKAQAVSGYDQYNQMQVRMHALAQKVKRAKTELGIK